MICIASRLCPSWRPPWLIGRLSVTLTGVIRYISRDYLFHRCRIKLWSKFVFVAHVSIITTVCMGWFQRGYKLSLDFFYAMLSLVPVGHFRNISGHLFTSLVCGSFQWRHGLLFTDCIVWDDEDKVIGFKRSHWIHLGWWSTGSPRLQLFQLSQHSHVTNCRLISSSAYFPWTMTLKYIHQSSRSRFRDFFVKTTKES